MRAACGMQSSALPRASCSRWPSKGVSCTRVGNVGEFGKFVSGAGNCLGRRTSGPVVGSRLPCVSISGEHCEVCCVECGCCLRFQL